MELKNVPFYANTSDDTHCFQAALKIVIKHFKPDKEYTWEELENLTAKKKGLWTWITKGVINMRKMGFDVIVKEDFDYSEFIHNGENYLREKYGPEVSQEQIQHSDIQQEIEIAKEYVLLFGTDVSTTNIHELKKFIELGYLLICNVNAATLNNKPGFVGHFVVVYGYDNELMYLHDPGLPPYKNRKVDLNQFIKAWEYPNKEARNFLAFKYEK